MSIEAIILFVLLFVILPLAIWATIEGKKRDKARDDFLANIPEFQITQKLLSTDGLVGLAIDEDRQKLCLFEQELSREVKHRIISYRDLLSSEIFEDGTTITKTNRTSQLGGALIGGIALGGVGAIIGGLSGKTESLSHVKRIDLRLVIDDTRQPLHDINLMNVNVTKTDGRYKEAMSKARHWHGLIEVLIRRADMEDNAKA